MSKISETHSVMSDSPKKKQKNNTATCQQVTKAKAQGSECESDTDINKDLLNKTSRTENKNVS